MAKYKLKDLSLSKLEYGSGAAACGFDGNARYVRITDITDDGKLTADIVSPSYYEEKHILHDGDILFARTGATVGKTFLYRNNYGKCVYAGFLIRMVPDRSRVLPDYIYYFTKSPRYRDFVAANMKVVAQPNINAKQYGDLEIDVPSFEEQQTIVDKLAKIDGLISLRIEQLAKLDQLVKSRFIELFGDPITNSNNLPTERMELRFNLKAGITTAADDIHDFEKDVYEIPCYGGNGIRGYVKEKTYSGNYPIIGRQGALCGNVQYATGEFHATEHAVLVSLLKDDNSVWVYYLLKLMDLYRYHTGAAQPGLAVKTLNTVEIIVADRRLQDQFATFVEQTDKSKLTIQQSLDKLELLKKSLMQEDFG